MVPFKLWTGTVKPSLPPVVEEPVPGLCDSKAGGLGVVPRDTAPVGGEPLLTPDEESPVSDRVVGPVINPSVLSSNPRNPISIV